MPIVVERKLNRAGYVPGYTAPEIWHVTDKIVIFHFGLFFTLLPPNSPKNQNFEKMKEMPGDITVLHTCTKNYDQMMYIWFLRYCV